MGEMFPPWLNMEGSMGLPSKASEEQEARILSYLIHNKDRARLFPFLSESVIPHRRWWFNYLKNNWHEHKDIPTEAECRSAWMKAATSAIEQAEGLMFTAYIYRDVDATGATLAQLRDSIVKKEVLSQLSVVSEEDDPEKYISKTRKKLDDLQTLFIVQTEEEAYCPFDPSYLTTRASKLMEEPETLISTGYPALDEATGGGLRYEDMVIISAVSGVGKTFQVINILYNLLIQGLKGLVINLDLPTVHYEKRTYARFSGIAIKEQVSPSQTHASLSHALCSMGVNPTQYVYKKFPSEMINIAQLRAFIRRIDELYGHRDFVIIDYLNQVLPDPAWGNQADHILVEKLFDTYRGMGSEMNKLMIAVHQNNYNDWDREREHRSTPKNLGSAKAIIRHAQLGFSLDQTVDEKSLSPTVVRQSVIKSSNGNDDIVNPCYVDYGLATITEMPDSDKLCYYNWRKTRVWAPPSIVGGAAAGPGGIVVHNNHYGIAPTPPPGM